MLKKGFLFLCFLFSAIIVFAQPVINRTTGANTVNDPRWMASLNLFIPRYQDTTAANLQKGVDSCGAIIFTYTGNSIWKRSCNPKKWEPIASALDTAYLSNDTLFLVNTFDTIPVVLNNIYVGNGTFTVGADSTGLIQLIARNSVDNTKQAAVEIQQDLVRIYSDKMDGDHGTITVQPDSAKLSFIDRGNREVAIRADTTGLTITDAIDSVGLIGKNLSTTKILSNDTAYTRVREVKRLINDSSGNYIRNDTTITQNGGFKLGTGSKIQADTVLSANRFLNVHTGVQVIDSSIVGTGVVGSGNMPVSGTGAKFMWYPGKYALWAGQSFNGTAWTEANVGVGSVNFGVDNIVSGGSAFSVGAANTASSNYSVVFGSTNTASGSSVALIAGQQNSVTGLWAATLGQQNTIGSANHAMAFGRGLQISSSHNSKFVIGQYNDGSAYNAFEIGWGGGTGSRANIFTVGTTGIVTTYGLDNYNTNLVGSYTSRSKVDKNYVDSTRTAAFSGSAEIIPNYTGSNGLQESTGLKYKSFGSGSYLLAEYGNETEPNWSNSLGENFTTAKGMYIGRSIDGYYYSQSADSSLSSIGADVWTSTARNGRNSTIRLFGRSTAATEIGLGLIGAGNYDWALRDSLNSGLLSLMYYNGTRGLNPPNTKAQYWDLANKKIGFGTTSAYNLTTNSLGIGTVSPSYNLDVQGTLQVLNSITSGTGKTYGTGVTFTSPSGVDMTNYDSVLYSNVLLSTANNGATMQVRDLNNNDTATIVNLTPSNIRFLIANAEKARITSAGLGIGTTSIEQPLTVAGNTLSVGNVYSKGLAWTAQTVPAANAWTRITYGNGLFVAVAGSSGSGTGRVMTSPDAVNWTTRTVANQDWNGVCWGNGLFVAVSAQGGVMTSIDGINWVVGTASAANAWTQVDYGNGLFVAVANGGNPMTSPDGITWTNRTAPALNNWHGLIYGNGLWVATAGSGTDRVMTSPDGITWTARTAASTLFWIDVTYGNGLFVAVGLSSTNSIMTSPDGITWTSRSTTNKAWWQITYGNGLFVAIAQNGASNKVMTSSDGITWTERATPNTAAYIAICYGNGIFVACASNTTTTTSVMTSGFLDYIPNNNPNNTYQGGMAINGRTTINGGVLINKDSATTITSYGRNLPLVIDTATGKIQKLQPLTNTGVLDFPSTAAGTSSDLTITVTGAISGDEVTIGVPAASVPDNGTFFAWVSSSNTVTIRFANNDFLNSKDPGSGTFRVTVTKY